MPKIVPETEMKKFNLYCGICLMIDIGTFAFGGWFIISEQCRSCAGAVRERVGLAVLG
jgi:hypothetical protein